MTDRTKPIIVSYTANDVNSYKRIEACLAACAGIPTEMLTERCFEETLKTVAAIDDRSQARTSSAANARSLWEIRELARSILDCFRKDSN